MYHLSSQLLRPILFLIALLHLTIWASKPVLVLDSTDLSQYHSQVTDLPTEKRFPSITLSEIGYQLSLNPFQYKTPLSSHVNLLYESLFRVSKTRPWELYGLLAQSLYIAPSRSALLIRLHPHAFFHNRQPITASDVAESLNYWSKHGPQKRSLPLLTFHPISPTKLFIQSESPLSHENILKLLEAPISTALCLHSRQCLLDPIKSGPFKLTQYTPNIASTFEKTKEYWGKDHPFRKKLIPFEHINVISYRNSQTAFLDFQNKAIDLFAIRYVEHWQTLKASRSPLCHLLKEPLEYSLGVSGFFYLSETPLAQHQPLRVALQTLFDSLQIDKILFQKNIPVSNNVFAQPQGPAPSSRPSLNQALHAIDKALSNTSWILKNTKRVHKETGSPLVFDLFVPNGHIEKIAMLYAKPLQSLGIEVRIQKTTSLNVLPPSTASLGITFRHMPPIYTPKQLTKLLAYFSALGLNLYNAALDLPGGHLEPTALQSPNLNVRNEMKSAVNKLIQTHAPFIAFWQEPWRKFAYWPSIEEAVNSSPPSQWQA